MQLCGHIPRCLLLGILCALVTNAPVAVAASMPSSTALFDSRVWQTDLGLPHNSVTALAQTTDGFLWVGTLKGVARFDGVKFTLLDLSSACSKTAPSITGLAAGQDGSLWIGTQNDGLIQLNSGALKRHSTESGLIGDSIKALLVARDGALWIGTPAGLSRLKDGLFTSFTRTNGLWSPNVRCIHEDERGVIWIVAGAGMQQVHQVKGDRVERVKISHPAFQNNALRALWADRQGVLWLGFSAGLLRHEPNGRNTFYVKHTGLVHEFVSSFFEDSSGNLWIGTHGGLSRVANRTLDREFNRSGAYFEWVNALAEDMEGNLWVGTKQGLYRLSQTALVMEAREHGLSHNNVMSVCENRPGDVWAGTWGGGLNWLRDAGILVFTQHESHQIGLTSDFILAIARRHANEFWIGTDYEGGVFKMTIETNGWPGFQRFGPEHGYVDGATRVIHVDSRTNVWFGTREALVCYEGGRFIRYTTNNGLVGVPVRDIIEDRQGSLWVGTDKGLSLFKEGEFRNFTTNNGLSDNAIRDVHEDPKTGVIWVGTDCGGLNRYQNGTFRSYTIAQGLFSEQVFDIVDDHRGSFWMTCLDGIFRVAKTDFDDLDDGLIDRLRCAVYRQNGLLDIQCNGVAKPGAIRSNNGRLLFATTRGVAVIDPQFVRTNAIVPNVYIKKVIANKILRRGFSAGNHEAMSARQSSGPEGGTLVLPPGGGELEFHFTAPSFQDPERVRFKHKLEGVDEDWVDAGPRRDARYNHIGPGHYRFRVIACNNDGVWNETGASVRLILQPHFWQTWWFYSLYVVAGVLTVGSGARYVTKRRMQRRLARLEQQHALERERGRIAKDMHDELGSSLTQISLLTELTRRNAAAPEKVRVQADRIAETARELVQNMDEIVWAVNPKNDNLNELAGYILAYAEDFLSLTSIRFRVQRPAALPALPLRAEVRHNVFLVVKEALNNVVKHSRASEVWLRLSVEKGQLQVVLEDNGIGLSEKAPGERVGNGLLNMRKRIEDVGGSFVCSSQPGRGTSIEIIVSVV